MESNDILQKYSTILTDGNNVYMTNFNRVKIKLDALAFYLENHPTYRQPIELDYDLKGETTRLMDDFQVMNALYEQVALNLTVLKARHETGDLTQSDLLAVSNGCRFYQQRAEKRAVDLTVQYRTVDVLLDYVYAL